MQIELSNEADELFELHFGLSINRSFLTWSARVYPIVLTASSKLNN